MPFYPAKTAQDEFCLDLAFQRDWLKKTDRYTYTVAPVICYFRRIPLLTCSNNNIHVSCLNFDIFHRKKETKKLRNLTDIIHHYPLLIAFQNEIFSLLAHLHSASWFVSKEASMVTVACFLNCGFPNLSPLRLNSIKTLIRNFIINISPTFSKEKQKKFPSGPIESIKVVKRRLDPGLYWAIDDLTLPTYTDLYDAQPSLTKLVISFHSGVFRSFYQQWPT